LNQVHNHDLFSKLLASINYFLIFQDAKGLKESHLIETIQDQAQLMLAQYINANTNYQSTRFGKLLLASAILKQIHSSSIEKLYFGQIVGNSSIDKLLCDLIKN
jgi:hypothetical protein